MLRYDQKFLPSHFLSVCVLGKDGCVSSNANFFELLSFVLFSSAMSLWKEGKTWNSNEKLNGREKCEREV